MMNFKSYLYLAKFDSDSGINNDNDTIVVEMMVSFGVRTATV